RCHLWTAPPFQFTLSGDLPLSTTTLTPHLHLPLGPSRRRRRPSSSSCFVLPRVSDTTSSTSVHRLFTHNSYLTGNIPVLPYILPIFAEPSFNPPSSYHPATATPQQPWPAQQSSPPAR